MSGIEKEGGRGAPHSKEYPPLRPKEENNDEDVMYLFDSTNVHATSND